MKISKRLIEQRRFRFVTIIENGDIDESIVMSSDYHSINDIYNTIEHWMSHPDEGSTWNFRVTVPHSDSKGPWYLNDIEVTLKDIHAMDDETFTERMALALNDALYIEAIMLRAMYAQYENWNPITCLPR